MNADKGDRTVTVTVDGSARPNPGVRTVAGVVTVTAGDGEGRVVTTRHTFRDVIAGHGCNNSAELHAVLAGLQAVSGLDMGDAVVDVVTDSRVVVELVVERANGRPTTAALAPLVQAVRDQLQAHPRTTLRWRPRRHVADADALARG